MTASTQKVLIILVFTGVNRSGGFQHRCVPFVFDHFTRIRVPIPNFRRVIRQESPVISKRRVHFLDFMLDVHERMHQCRKRGISGENMVASVTEEILREGWLLCFDEMQVGRPLFALSSCEIGLCSIED